MNRAGQHRDAVPAHLVTEVLAGDADSARAGRTQHIHIQVLPLLDRGTSTTTRADTASIVSDFASWVIRRTRGRRGIASAGCNCNKKSISFHPGVDHRSFDCCLCIPGRSIDHGAKHQVSVLKENTYNQIYR